jgi:sugar phosphate isomerase/epimerase
MNLDGGDVKVLLKNPCNMLYTDGKLIYYQLKGSQKYLYSMKMDGSQSVALLKTNCNKPIIMKDEIHYLNEKGNICVYSIKNRENKIVSDCKANYYNLNEQYIYYTDKKGLCRIDKEGKNFKRIYTNGYASTINIIGDYIFFNIGDGYCKIKNDESEYTEYFDNYNGLLALHAPYDAVIKNTNNKVKIEKAKTLFKKTFFIADYLKVKTVIFHTGYSAIKENFPGYKEKYMEKQIEFWKEYIKSYEHAGIMAVLENTNESMPEILIKIVDAINSDNLKLCIDTGHINFKPNVTAKLQEWIEKEDNRLRHMHLHNNYGFWDDHNSLLKGSINFKELFKTLQNQNLNPDLSLEIFDYNQTIESVNYLRNELLKQEN